MKPTKTERKESIQHLQNMLKPGDEVYTQCKHVSASGMTRWLDVYVIRDNRPHRITWDVCAAADFTFCNRRGQLKIEGCGMDMGFQTVYCLGASLWPDGTPEPHGNRNGEPDSTGGYALTHRWLN
jgi:hypothetical protein